MSWFEDTAGVRDLVLPGHVGTVLYTIPEGSVHCCITSPPYWGLRSYLADDDPMKKLEIGAEATPEEYVARLVGIFRAVRRVLRDDGTLWINLGDSYASSPPGNKTVGVSARSTLHGVNGPSAAYRETLSHSVQSKKSTIAPGLKPKDLVGIPWRVAFALQSDGWYLRSACPWLKRNCMPESIKDRPTAAHEMVFLLAKSSRYFYDHDAVKLPSTMKPQRRPNRRPMDTTPRQGQPKQAWSTAARDEVAVDGSADGRNRRTSDWFFESIRDVLDHGANTLLTDEDGDPLAFIVNPVPLKAAHFAAFPPALVIPMIKASTSERGVCPECGAPWVQVVERSPMEVREGPGRAGLRAAAQGGTSRTACTGTMTKPPESHATGWRPTCDHDREPVPALVLDPFMGAGTVGMVARELGRSYVGIEMSLEYATMSRRRIDGRL